MADDVAVCPRCGSTEVSERSGVLRGTGIGTGYTCEECGFSGDIFPEVKEEDVDAFRQQLDEEVSDDVEELERSPAVSRIAMGAVLVLLGTGSLLAAGMTLHGVWGAFLLPVGLYVLYEEWRRFRGTP